ncbi:protein-glutamate O-methyltransferase CheR [Pseudomonas sp. CBSPBW29]|jgi:chemotaxis protein methyltransferase CheR|uniref:CheR family methyltransferase n=1 Tax=Pseudomonas TaxID=286 RepID=UPI0021AD46EB|nr:MULTISPECIES: protein-glutamate O-methyltransferase CheR [unclassified Pseudomonas]WEL42906.1 protein-glutamate O-methyltransferase CheR [Pseudomonas sp. CBSPBW29]WEL63974.1 protein-glutamate O-methyltransferase CheR [Pseudomonas sp. CBSPGW29]WEL73765.1 protein-glutamate O-methyltransferase CheR [Pseudomonas sp. CBSPCGW29]WEL74473.1 protein-glutamate O-methyltransferase CheR [Pseudomonas sp. CBSPAW29]WEL81288.1 protein-glutamate O-methyltransferase CheR [Pseudomonas sp. CBSPCAW29]WEL89786.
MNVILSDAEFLQFRSLIHEIAGISMSDAKKQLVSGRLSKRLQIFKLNTYGAYYKVLMKDRAELQVAVDLLTTNETYFFREPKHFDFLRDVALPELRGSGPLRVWSGACSTGEEPYTLAMVLADSLVGRPWEIVASDISSRVLDKARQGRYPLDGIRGIPEALLKKYCLKGVGSNHGCFMVEPALASRIDFQSINLNNPLPKLGLFDVIFLRNVMIYFDNETKVQVVKRLLSHLKPGGYFMVSHSESLNGITDELRLIKPSIYRRPHA